MFVLLLLISVFVWHGLDGQCCFISFGFSLIFRKLTFENCWSLPFLLLDFQHWKCCNTNFLKLFFVTAWWQLKDQCRGWSKTFPRRLRSALPPVLAHQESMLQCQKPLKPYHRTMLLWGKLKLLLVLTQCCIIMLLLGLNFNICMQVNQTIRVCRVSNLTKHI